MQDRRERVLLVDRDEDVTSILERGLRREGYDTASASDAARALETVHGWRPDALVIDVAGMEALRLCRVVRAERPDAGILLITATEKDGDQVAGLDAGADDYLMRPFNLSVLAAHIRSVLRRRAPTAEVLRAGDLELDVGSRRARRGPRELSLTNTEYRLLLQLVHDAGVVVPKRELAARVWGYDFSGDLNVLEVYIGYLREKLEAAGEPRVIHTQRGVGYVLRPSAS